MKTCFCVLRWLVPLAALPVFATAASLPTGGTPLLAADAPGAFSLQTLPAAEGAASFSVVDAAGPGFARAWQIETKREINPPWAIGLQAASGHAVAEGGVGLIHFFARTLSTADETGAGRVHVSVLKNSRTEFVISLDEDLSFGREWQEFWLPFKFRTALAAGDARVAFQFGFMRQTVQIGGLEVIDHGDKVAFDSLPRTRFTYAGREPGAAWRKAAQVRIEQIRKGDVILRVVDGAGRAVGGAKVRIEETHSAFQWGSALMMSRLVQESPDNRIYREKVLQLFEEASTENDLKWPAWLGQRIGSRSSGGFAHEQTLAGLRWLRANNFHTRGHVLVWPGWRNLPKPVIALRDAKETGKIPELVRAHIREMAQATNGLLEEWDVLNEPFTNHDLMDLFGRDIMVDWFKTAHEAMPGLRLFLNDFSNQDATTDAAHVAFFEDTVKYLLDHGATVTGLGVQAHIGGHPNAPEQVLKTFDGYEKFGLPLRITEFDIRTDDEELQADYTRDFLTLCFSHPSVIGVQLWGFWEKAHWRPNAAMYRADWSEKPNGKVYRSLVLDQWRTHLDGRTDGEGAFQTRAFYGDYVVTAEVGGRRVARKFTLRAGAPVLEWVVEIP